MAGVLALDRDDLTAIVEAALHADEVRALCLMALRAIDDGHGFELPISSPAAAGLGSRGLPFRICHVFLLLRRRTARTVVVFLTARSAEPGTMLVTEEHDRERRVGQLSHEVREVEFVAHEDVALAEGIFAIAARVESFVDDKVQQKPDIVEAAGTHALGHAVETAREFETATDAPYTEFDVDRSPKRISREIGKDDRLAEVEFATGVKDGADGDVRASDLHERARSHPRDVCRPKRAREPRHSRTTPQ